MEYPKPDNHVSEQGFTFGCAIYDSGFISVFSHRLDGPLTDKNAWGKFGRNGRIDGRSREQYIWNNQYIERSEQEYKLHLETLKLRSITQFIDFVARTDILLIL